MGESRRQRRSCRREAASETAVAAARHPARGGRLAAAAQGPQRSAPGTTGGRPICWTTSSTRSCVTRSPNGRPGSPARSGHIGCATTDPGSTDYYDDMAWLALALERAGRLAGVEKAGALEKLCEQFVNAWVPEDGGGIPWRKQDQFFNAPANGPAGHLPRPLRRPAAPRPADGRLDRRNPDRSGDPSGVRRHQGRFDGARAVHLLPGRGARVGDRTRRADRGPRPCRARAPAGGRGRRAHGARRGDQGRGRRRRRPVQRHPGALSGVGRDHTAEERSPRTRAACETRKFGGARVGEGRLGQSADRRRACRCSARSGIETPSCRPQAGRTAEFVEGAVNSSSIPERDLSVQLSGWMLMEAAHTAAARGELDTADDESGTPISD